MRILLTAIAISLLVGGYTGWTVKSKFYRAAESVEIKKALVDFGIEAQNTVNEQDKEWNALVDKVGKELKASAEARQRDSLAEAETARTLKETGDAIRRISKTIPLVENVGVCLLTDDFISVWNDIKEAANIRRTEAEN